MAPPNAARGADPPRYPELQSHYDAVYDRLAAGRTGRAAGPLLDVGSGDGAALAATVEGTGIGGVALDRRAGGEWRGPAGFARVTGDAARLPFAAGAFPAVLMQETWEWLSRPAVVAGELARVSRGRVVIVQSDWRTLWLDSGDPETAREFTRLFAGPTDPRARRAGGTIGGGRDARRGRTAPRRSAARVCARARTRPNCCGCCASSSSCRAPACGRAASTSGGRNWRSGRRGGRSASRSSGGSSSRSGAEAARSA